MSAAIFRSATRACMRTPLMGEPLSHNMKRFTRFASSIQDNSHLSSTRTLKDKSVKELLKEQNQTLSSINTNLLVVLGTLSVLTGTTIAK